MKLSKLEEKMILLLEQEPIAWSSNDLVVRFNVSRTTIRHLLDRLLEKGWVTTKATTKHRYWIARAHFPKKNIGFGRAVMEQLFGR